MTARSTDGEFLDHLVGDLARGVLGYVSDRTGRTVVSELSWTRPRYLGSTGGGTVESTLDLFLRSPEGFVSRRVSRLELGAEETLPRTAVVLVEVSDEHGFLYAPGAAPSWLEVTPRAVRDLADGTYSPALWNLGAIARRLDELGHSVSEAPSNTDLAEVTLRAHAAPDGLLRDVTDHLDRLPPVLTPRCGHAALEGGEDVRLYLSVLRALDDGAPLEWAVRRSAAAAAP